jgi:hypothetical protein
MEQERSLNKFQPVNESPWTLPVGQRQNRDDVNGELHDDSLNSHLVASSSAPMTSLQTERGGSSTKSKAFKSTRFEENSSGLGAPTFLEPTTNDPRRISREFQSIPKKLIWSDLRHHLLPATLLTHLEVCEEIQ